MQDKSGQCLRSYYLAGRMAGRQGGRVQQQLGAVQHRSFCPTHTAPHPHRLPPSEPVHVGESEEWLRVRAQDVAQHAAQTLEYDW